MAITLANSLNIIPDMTRYLQSRSLVFLAQTMLVALFLNFLAVQYVSACTEPPPLPPGVTVTPLDDFGQTFEIRLDGYSTFGSPDGTHFCVCGLGFLQNFPFEIIDIVDARLVLAGTNETFMTFDFDFNLNTTLDLPLNEGLDFWIGLFAEVNGEIDPNIPVDLVFILAVDQFPTLGEKRKLSRAELLYTAEEIRGSIAFVMTDEGNADGTLSGNHPGLFDVRVSLPVELVDFNASLDEDENVQLNWSTISETNNSGFDVQHRFENDFESLGFVTGAGTVTETQNYSFNVRNLLPGIHQFRIKQVDFDGSSTFSDMVEAEIDLPGNYLIVDPYPNPFTTETSVQFSVKETQEVAVYLYDMLGKELDRVVSTVSAGQIERVFFSSDNRTSGVYLIHLKGSNFEKSMPVTLIR